MPPRKRALLTTQAAREIGSPKEALLKLRPHDNDDVYEPGADEAYFRQRLKLEAAKIEPALQSSRQQLRDLAQVVFLPDAIDVSTVISERADAQARLKVHETLAERIRAALRRLDQGSFGVCLTSHQEIPLKRLFVEPWATRTVDAQDVLETATRKTAGNFGISRSTPISGPSGR